VLAPNARLRCEIIPSPAEHANRALKRSRAGRAAAHELGQAAQTGLRHQHRPLLELWRHLEDHRRPFDRHRRSAGDCQNPRPSEPIHPRPASVPRAASRSIPNGLRAETGCQRKPTMPLGLSLSERPDGEQIKRFRPLRRPTQPKRHRDFHQTERRLTTPRSGDIAPARKKGGLKFL
jgi:hypothetical protein